MLPSNYIVQTLRQAIQNALNNGSHLFADYKVEYDQRLARYMFSNPFTISGESFLLYTQESLKIEAHQDTPPLSAVIVGAFRQVGLVNGPAILCNINTGPVSASDVPNLQANTQLFITTNVGNICNPSGAARKHEYS